MSNTPQRPSNIPPASTWEEDDEEWMLAECDEEGKHHGLVKWWREDGTLCCETNYVHNTPTGAYQRFHENGETSRKGTFVEGKLHGTDQFFRSSEETSETFPRGLGADVARAEMDYAMGRVVTARCFDAKDAKCMEDGSPFPSSQPSSVPKEAHFRKREEDGEYRWVMGTVNDKGDGTIDRVGTWRWWTPEGVLVAEESYDDKGQHHGLLKTFDDEGALLTEMHYQAGEQHGSARTYKDGVLVTEKNYVEGDVKGPQLRQLDEEECDDDSILSMRGEFDDDDPVGIIEYLDAQGKVIGSVDTGRPDSLEITQEVLEESTGLNEIAKRLLAEGHVGPALFALIRAVGRGEAAPEVLQQALARQAHPIAECGSGRRASFCQHVVSSIQRFGGGPDKCVNNIFEGIRKGGDPWELIRFSAATLDNMGMPEIAGEVIDGLVKSAPSDRATAYEFTRTLVRASLGDSIGAMKSAQALASDDPDLSKRLQTYIRAFFPTWDYWPEKDSRARGLSKLTPLLSRTQTKTQPELAPYRLAIQKSATRLQDYRQRLVESMGEHDWLVPDLAHLLPDGPVEVAIPDKYQGTGTQHLCRQEWIRLTLLCHLVGLEKIELPETIGRCPHHLELHLVATARLFIAYDVDPEERMTDLLSSAEDLVSEENLAKVVAVAVELANDSDWFGTKLSNIENLLDSDFLHSDEGSYMSVFKFFGDTSTDLFDEEEDDDEYDDDDEDDEYDDDE